MLMVFALTCFNFTKSFQLQYQCTSMTSVHPASTLTQFLSNFITKHLTGRRNKSLVEYNAVSLYTLQHLHIKSDCIVFKALLQTHGIVLYISCICYPSLLRMFCFLLCVFSAPMSFCTILFLVKRIPM